MSIRVQIRRGSSNQHSSFTGANGEITYDTTNKTLRVHDGITAGGIKLAKIADLGASANLLSIPTSLVPSANATYDLGTSDKRWGSLYLSGNTVYIGNVSIGVTNTGSLEFKSTESEATFASFSATEPSGFANVNITNASISNVILNGVLGVEYGGTGLTSLTAGGVLYASNSSVFGFATGNENDILTIANGMPTFSGEITTSMDGGTF